MAKQRNRPRELAVENIQTDLQLLTNDVWELDDLQAEVAGAKNPALPAW